MNLGTIVGLFADIHGTYRTLEQALAVCRAEGVTKIALLGDLLDRVDQADACALALAGWEVIGVYGNHDREIALAASEHAIALRDETIQLLLSLQEQVMIDDVLLTHEVEHWGHHHRYAGLLGSVEANGTQARARITFAGHTHYRHVRDERGPIDLGRGRVTLSPHRRYLINPGALADGRFAIWDRTTQVIQFRQVMEE